MRKKHYVFRRRGTDGEAGEGGVALLTDAEAKKIKARLDALTGDATEDPPYYFYPMELLPAKEIHAFISADEPEVSAAGN